MSDSEDPINLPDEAGDDLFGDGDDNNLDEVLSQSPKSDRGRALSDGDLASDRGRGYGDDLPEDRDDQEQTREQVVMTVPMYRHRIPKSKGNQLQSFKVPKFLKFQPEEYKPSTYTPSKWDLDNAASAKEIPVVRYKRDPATGKMVSNTNIYRWSDGSVTLAVGDDHYEIETKSLAPPSNEPYQEIRDAHYYAAAAHLSSNCLLIVGHLTEEYSVRPNKDVQDDALEKLHRKMAEAAKSNVANIIIQTTEDPELKRKQAELAEKERNKAQRRRETAAARMEGSGRYARGGALSIGDLEGGRRGAGGAAAGRKRGAAGGAQSRKRNRNAEYDSDDDLPGGAGRHDEYVLDDFAVASDEEASEGEDDEEEEILDDDEDEEEEEAPRRKRQRTAEKEVGDEDAEGEVDDDAAPAPVQETASRRRGRRVVEDDDDE